MSIVKKLFSPSSTDIGTDVVEIELLDTLTGKKRFQARFYHQKKDSYLKNLILVHGKKQIDYVANKKTFELGKSVAQELIKPYYQGKEITYTSELNKKHQKSFDLGLLLHKNYLERKVR